MKRKAKLIIASGIPEADAPFNILRPPLTVDNQDITTALLLAGEALAEPFRPAPPYPAPEFARSEGEAENNFDWLLEIVTLIRQKLQGNPRRAELLTDLTDALGDDGIRLLFRSLFPAEPILPHRDAQGKAILSQAEINILREAAGDRSHEEIAVHLKISPRTVSTHFTHIYRKLGVQSPIKAVALAIAMGYLDMDALDIVHQSSHRCMPRDFSALHSTLSGVASASRGLDTTDLKMLAEFGLFLSAACGMSAQPLSDEQNHPAEGRRGLICELNAQGRVLRWLEAEGLGDVKSLVVAPPASASHGFTPGNLFAAYDSGPVHGLNRNAITEFTPQGEFVRAFTGSRKIETRLIGVRRICFTASGHLLAASSNGLMRFMQNGRRQEIFVGGCCIDVCEDSAGHFYLLRHSTLGSRISVHNANGTTLRDFGHTVAGDCYYCLVLSGEKLFASHYSTAGIQLKTFAPQGDFLREFFVFGYEAGLFAANTDRLFVPSRRDENIQVFSTDGSLLRRIDLRGIISPFGVTLGAEGHLWVCGAAP